MQNWYSCLLSSSRWWVSILSIIIYVKKISQIWRCNRNIHVHLTFSLWQAETRSQAHFSCSGDPYVRTGPKLLWLGLQQVWLHRHLRLHIWGLCLVSRNCLYARETLLMMVFVPTIIVTDMFSGVLGELHPSRWLLWSLRPSSTSPS